LSLLAVAVVATLVSACSTPFCNAPGGLCAPGQANTSPPPKSVAPPPQAGLPKPPPEPPLPAAQTFSIALPGAAGVAEADDSQPVLAPAPARRVEEGAMPSNTPIRVGLLLPTRSETLGAAAEALRAGFLAAWERDRDNITVTVLETGDVAQDILSTYAKALENQDLVVGPLSRSAVTTVAGSPLVSKPTIVLNYPEGHGQSGAASLPDNMLAIGLSIEEEARQVAQWAAADHPGGSALVLTTGTQWQRRVAAAFAGQWQRLGFAVRMVELSAPDSYLSDPELVQLRARLRQESPSLLFSAMSADQTRQLRGALGSALSTEPTNPIISTADAMPAPPAAPAEQFSNLPIYGTSALNPGGGNSFASQDLDGVRLLDLPWQIQRDHPAVMVYPHQSQAGGADMERLYALGIDAYRVAREIGRHPSGRFHLDGVTGKLTIDFGQGRASFERIEPAAIYKNGMPQAVSQ
jgi:outer membrane PBP1 activator LpoA protein